ncbi:hydrogenase maturation peptidase HycI [Pyrococcus sp. ST04]|uniref:hydrogenase maturation peptidase HycI n=1 Tax=Pyrococcus sp. ST04 TaxID=1183377 RepID=UPI0002605E4A|nr:hydrogenase maturation peptidase HycI [Pyrococcus sp. ST04]AFK22557.1 putative hydrogenase maturation protease HycI [Pyrococcus sp. ST04]
MNLKQVIKSGKRIVICGIGNEIRGDDGFGVLLVKELKKLIKRENVLILNCGQAPESFFGKIIKFKPDLVIFVDAIHFGGNPGEIVVVTPESVIGEAFSTHGMPLKLMAKHIERDVDAEIILIGCQPKNIGLFEEISPEVKEALEKLLSIIADALNDP